MKRHTVSATPASTTNPGLAPFDLTGYTGVHGQNFYEEDRLLQKIIEKHTSSYTKEHSSALKANLHKYGKLAGGLLDDLVSASHKDGKWGEIKRFDRLGKRIDKIEYCMEQREVRRINYEYGILNLDFHPEWSYKFTECHRMALAYLASTNGEGGVTCPLAMADGMLRVLQALGTPAQKKKYIGLVADPKSKSHFMVGQYVTERVGGSNVATNRTVAHNLDNGKWLLNGEKWFCSNPGDLWVTTARIEGSNTIGLFLVSRLKDDGEINGCHIVRKKDIIGTKGKLTVEVIYENVEAELLGERPSHGLLHLIKHVIQISRLHVSLSSIAFSRRAFMEARAYTRQRTAYGRKIGAFFSVQRVLAEMQILHSSMLWCIFENINLYETNNRLSSLLIPLLKYSCTVHTTWITHEAMLLHGGNGILNDFTCLPRLHNDAIINETWEGNHQLMTDHTLKAFARPRIQEAYFNRLDENCKDAKENTDLSYALEIFQKERALLQSITKESKEEIQASRFYLCDLIYHTLALSEWIHAVSSDNALKLKPKEKSIYTSFALGLAEIIEKGRACILKKDSIFRDKEKIEELIAY